MQSTATLCADTDRISYHGCSYPRSNPLQLRLFTHFRTAVRRQTTLPCCPARMYGILYTAPQTGVCFSSRKRMYSMPRIQTVIVSFVIRCPLFPCCLTEGVCIGQPDDKGLIAYEI